MRRGTRFAGSFPPRPAAALSRRAYPHTWVAWQRIEQRPGMSVRELAAAMDCSITAAYMHVQRLRAWGVLPVVRAKQARALVARIPYAAQSFLEPGE